MYQSD